MTDPVAVLVVVPNADPGGLAAPQVFGHPPLVYRNRTSRTGGSWGDWGRQSTDLLLPREVAVPLWWDGALVPEGWDRAGRRAGAHTAMRSGARVTLVESPDVGAAVMFARYLVYEGLAARAVLLDRVVDALRERS